MTDDLRPGTWVTYSDGEARGWFVRRCRVEVVAGADAGQQREFEASLIRIGARAGCDLVLADPKVSGLHCEIILDEHGYRLRDLESTNGTWVGGHRIGDIHIYPGTLIEVGSSRLRFEPLGQGFELTVSSRDRFGGLVGRTVAMRELFARLERIAPTDATVLITGETGTGKDLIAEALHDASPRAAGPFVVLDCGSIPINLVESELFGHERGAFTGATATYVGAFERAHGGTLFLDEIGELPLELQPKLLRVLERREIRRLGGSKVIPTDIRVIAATHRELGVEVNNERFREDLYYRLAVAQVHVPPLRERKADIPLLVEHFLATLAGGEPTRIQPEAIERMQKHEWPGNVRELRNVIERALVLTEAQHAGGAAAGRAEGDTTPLGQTQPYATPFGVAPSGAQVLQVPIDVSVPFKLAKQHLIEGFERRYMRALLAQHGGNVSAAARAAGIDRMSVHKILQRVEVVWPGEGPGEGES